MAGLLGVWRACPAVGELETARLAAVSRDACSCRTKRAVALVANASSHTIAVLAGDGIGPEISAVASQVLREAGEAEGVQFNFEDSLIGGAATDATGTPLPDSTLEACKRSDAVLLAAIGGCD